MMYKNINTTYKNNNLTTKLYLINRSKLQYNWPLNLDMEFNLEDKKKHICFFVQQMKIKTIIFLKDRIDVDMDGGLET